MWRMNIRTYSVFAIGALTECARFYEKFISIELIVVLLYPLALA